MWAPGTSGGLCELGTYCFYVGIVLNRGTRWRSGWGTALQTGRSRDRFPMVSLEFFIDIILPAALWPWDQVPWMFLGVKGGRCVGPTTLPPSYADCLKNWEPQTPVILGACQGLQWDCFTFTFIVQNRGRNSSVSVATGYRLDGPGIESNEAVLRWYDEDTQVDVRKTKIPGFCQIR
jgi:hypothetical protein